MTLQDWIDETRERYRTEPLGRATVESAAAFWHGGVRRTVDPHVGRSIWERDGWDICVVCDAARVDLMREAIVDYGALPDPGDVRRVWSNASCSIDWINRTFNEHKGETGRVGYVTANPFAHHSDPDCRTADLSEPQVGHLRLLYKSEWTDVGGGIETVPPERVTDHAIDAWRRRDELGIDRLVVHYMQPHEPFRSRPEWGAGDNVLLKNLVEEGAGAGSSIFPAVRRGDVDLDEFREVYLDNHHWVLEDIAERLIGNVGARVAITADHANGLGEFPNAWHHPPGRVHPAVRTVPWTVVSSVDRHSVEPVVDGEDEEGREVAEQLEALGYR